MTRKPATSAAEYLENTIDENKQRELHPHDTGAIDFDAFIASPQAQRRQIWAVATDADKRGLAIAMLRRNNHGPDEANISLYLGLMEARFGLSEVEQAIVGALSRLARQEAQSARTARDAGLKDDAAFFQRSANAYTKALGYYLAGTRPTPTQTGPAGWLLPSQRSGEAPHLLTMDGDWMCTCAAGGSMHWAKALIVGIEVGYDDLAAAADDGTAIPEGTDDDDYSDVPAGPGEPTRARLDVDTMAAALVQRLTMARAARIAA